MHIYIDDCIYIAIQVISSRVSCFCNSVYQLVAALFEYHLLRHDLAALTLENQTLRQRLGMKGSNFGGAGLFS